MNPGDPAPGHCIVVDDLLDASDHAIVRAALRSPLLRWARADAADRASRGNVYQLATRDEHDALPMHIVREVMLLATYRQVRHLALLRGVDEIVPQVFPVWMLGHEHASAHQTPHRDECVLDGRAVHPVITMVYYVSVVAGQGGAFLGFDARDSRAETFRHLPRDNQLVVIRGDQLHGVDALTAGHRISLVVNYYDATRWPSGLGSS